MTEIRAEIRDFRQATTSSFNAMREDLNDLRGEMRSRFAEVDNAFARVDNGFAEMRGKFDASAAGQQHIADLLTRLIRQENGE